MIGHKGVFTLIAFSFFGWGVLRSFNDVLVAAFQSQNPMHDARAMLIHSSFSRLIY
jgi:fucose permease